MGHWIDNYWYEEPYEPFIVSISDYMSNGGQIIFVGVNDLDDVNSFFPDQLNWGWMGYGCCNSLFNDGNWDSENPIMSGIDPDSLNFFLFTLCSLSLV